MNFLDAALLVCACASCSACSIAACPTGDIPAACPDTGAPSYVNDVARIISQECLSCHSQGGEESSLPLGSYEDVFAERQEALDQIYSCQMPQSGSLSTSQRATLLTWFACGAPQN